MSAYMPAAMSAIDGPNLAGFVGGAGHRDEAGLALDQQVVGLRVAVAIAKDAAQAFSTIRLTILYLARRKPMI